MIFLRALVIILSTFIYCQEDVKLLLKFFHIIIIISRRSNTLTSYTTWSWSCCCCRCCCLIKPACLVKHLLNLKLKIF
ncbi:hypothetical protein RIF29_41887 [Crotalaria pallida]|uniref:Secreted protein n=1 Tax=Crotalaria pallida TaxID=3830 RepID=A0AAN9E6J7_CROPI